MNRKEWQAYNMYKTSRPIYYFTSLTVLLERLLVADIILIIYAATLNDESRPKLRKLRNQKQRQIYSPRLKWHLMNSRNTAFVVWNLSYVRALNILIFDIVLLLPVIKTIVEFLCNCRLLDLRSSEHLK